MIIREWRGRASFDKAEAYPQFFRDNVLPQLRRLSGFLGVHFSRRRLDDAVEFLVLTRWQSMDAVREFAGPDPETAVVEPGATGLFLAYDTRVQHYDVIEASSSSREDL